MISKEFKEIFGNQDMRDILNTFGKMKCKVCGREFSKWRFCLECGAINHAYTNKNYIGE